LSGDEYSVIWPKSISSDRQESIIRTFTASEDKYWTDVPFVNQSPRFLCDPKIWFYVDDVPPEVADEPKGDNIIPFPKM
jgi:hypothetical protein